MPQSLNIPPPPPGAPQLPPIPQDGILLHIGGKASTPGWTVYDIDPAPHVDIQGDCSDMAAVGDASCAVVYASHVFEHLGYDRDLPRCLVECHRILKPGGRLLSSVPDFDTLCRLFVDKNSTFEDRYIIMQVIFGGRTTPHDVHFTGLSLDIMSSFLRKAGFASGYRVAEFGLFQDSSSLRYHGVPISLNLVSIKA